jgi:uncharacterized SAM-binding protein YcdF (DUF218 family)
MVSLKTAVRTRRMKWAAARVGVLCAIVLILGFGIFVGVLPREQVVLDHGADGIVVLTGGTSRVIDALELLKSHHGRRLLITGVNPGTTTIDIAREAQNYDRELACCVDLDYSAINTLGNAVQARLWANKHDFRSLIVVTSAYHMPRALAELEHQLPNVALVPYPVLSDRLRVEPWWTNGDITKLVLSEYLKYLFAELRMRFDSVAVDNRDGRTSYGSLAAPPVRWPATESL